MLAAAGQTLATYIQQNFQELATQAGVAAGTEGYRTFGDRLHHQWMDYFHLQTGSNPSLSLVAAGLDVTPVKVAFEAAYALAQPFVFAGMRLTGVCVRLRCSMSVPKRVNYQEYASSLLAIELANGKVTSARNGMVAVAVAARDHRITNAMAKANAAEDKQKGYETRAAGSARSPTDNPRAIRVCGLCGAMQSMRALFRTARAKARSPCPKPMRARPSDSKRSPKSSTSKRRWFRP